MESKSKCPFTGAAERSKTNRDWWPNQLDLSVLHRNPPQADPMGAEFDYAAEFETLDLAALKQDIEAVMTTRASAASSGACMAVASTTTRSTRSRQATCPISCTGRCGKATPPG